MKARQAVAIVLISASSALATLWGYNHFAGNKTYLYAQDSSGKIPANYAKFFDGQKFGNTPVDFTEAASAAIPATVHIKTKSVRNVSNNLPKNPFSDLFGLGDDWGFGNGMRSIPEMASGSGVIISEDGYIVTNNHVVDGADDITVTLSNRKSFKAKVIGIDPSTDLAVIKIEAKGLPFLLYGNSDEAKIGQWVLAVGYPLNLETTVTAGIISAKGRTLDINMRQSKTPIESFIQTDAAVNPGNSGGPLINPEGQLIGINSAIASPTGSYAGYSFTVPVNIVKKVVGDLIKYGTPQRAYLGVKYLPDNASDEQKKEAGVQDGEGGVYVLDVPAEGAAAKAGIAKGDKLTKINGVALNSAAEMVGLVATYRPGDKVNVTYQRNGKEFTVPLVLHNNAGTTDVVKNNSIMEKLGADLQTLTKKDATDLNVKGGVVVKAIDENGLFSKTRMEEGFVILKANGKDVNSVDDFRRVLENSDGSVKLEGVYPGYEGSFQYPLRLNGGQ